MSTQTIGQLSRRTDTPVATIRYYESIGLLPGITRGAGGQRCFAEADAMRLAFIRSRRDLGYSLGQVRTLLAASEGIGDCAKAQASAERQLVLVRSRIAQLRRIESELTAQLQDCATACTDVPASRCALIPAAQLRLPRSEAGLRWSR